MTTPLTILRLTSENIKRISAVEVRPDPNDALVIVSGKNGQGKTSLLDSIALALGGGKEGRTTTLPIREGESHATVVIDFGEFTVTKTWEHDRTPKLVVMSKDGATYKSPQTFLDDRLGALSFDPLAFTRLAPKDQLAALLELVTLPFEPEVLAAQRDTLFGQRTDVNRSIRNMEGELARIPSDVDEAPDELVSTTDVLDQLDTAQRQQRHNDAVRAQHAEACERIQPARDLVEQLERELDQAKRQLAAAIANADTLAQSVTMLPEVPDTEAFHTLLHNAEAINDSVRRKQAKRELAVKVVKAQSAAESLTLQIEAIDKQKTDALAEANMPVNGLAFDETGVTYNAIPFAQCSAAEQLRVSTAMAMALNPSIAIIRITDGSLLDAGNLAILREMATDRHFQVWIERVSNDSGVGFELVDGALA